MIGPEELSRRERIKLGLSGIAGGLAIAFCISHFGKFVWWATDQITAFRQITGF